MRYRAEIDGLRAIAVLSVIFYHAGFRLFDGGYIGVDIFFVISGYLITSLILEEKKSGTFSLLNFYERRARRILPALFLVMAACIPFALMLLLPRDMKEFSESLIAVSAFISNIYFSGEVGYFDTAAELKPLLHTWSLAVEEQYYIIFPAFLLVIWRLGRPVIIASLAILALASLGVAQWSAEDNLNGAFFLLRTRGWEILLGVFLAFYLFNRKDIQGNQALSLLGVLLMAGAIFGYDAATPFPSIYTLVPTIGTALVIVYATPETHINRWLSNRVLVGIGLISYSAYLWHYPLFAFLRIRFGEDLNVYLAVTAILISLVLSFLSWKFVEVPFRTRIRPSSFSRSTIFRASAFMATFFIAFGSYGYAMNGFFSDADKQRFELLSRHMDTDLPIQMHDDSKCVFWSHKIDPDITKRFNNCSRSHGKAVIILGDSHAMNLHNILANTGEYPFIFGFSQAGCHPFEKEEGCHYESFDTFLSEYSENIGLVLYHQSGAFFIKDANGEVDNPQVFNEGEPYKFSQQYVNAVIAYLNRIGKNVKVVWIGPFVESRVNIRNKLQVFDDLHLNEKSINIFNELDAFIELIIRAQSKISFNYLAINSILEIDKEFFIVGDCITYRDEDHFSKCGEKLLSRRLASPFRELVHDLR